jgi:type I restriction enzyme, S subunit
MGGKVVSEAPKTIGAAELRRFRPYPAYKNSGVDWLGQIPEHWTVSRISELTTLINGYPFDSEYFVRADGTPLIRIRDLNSTETEVNYIGPIVENVWIKSGDVIIGMDGDFNVARWRGRRGLLNQRMCCLRMREDTDSRFIAYLLPIPLKVINDLTYSTTVKHLSSSDVRKIRLGRPTGPDQRAIATFLDRETAKIDALVAEKERLIALLQEKRATIITRAVTKGLDPSVPMKDSGVEWLGAIPAHWEVKRLWHLTPSNRQIMYGIVLPGPNVDDGVPIVKGGDVSPARLRLDRLSRTTFEIESAYVRSRLKGGDIVYAIRGSIGEVAMVPDELEGANLTQDAARVAYTSASYGRWLLYALKSQAVFSQLEAGALGATIRGINIRDLKRALIPVPPRAEQEAIASFLLRETTKFDGLMARIQGAIDRLKEFRTALISAAVTGKIDLREEAA